MDTQNSRFFQKSLKNASYHGFWSRIPLGSLQEPAKSLPGASQEPFKGSQEAPMSLEEAPCSLLRAVSEPQKTVIGSIFERFLKKMEILGVHLGDVLTSKIIFLRVPRGYPT